MDAAYREVWQGGAGVVEGYKPLAKGDKPYAWVSENTIAPWVIYVLRTWNE